MKARRYHQRIKQFRQNRIIDSYQKKMYAEFNEDGLRPNEVQNAAQSKDFRVKLLVSGKPITEKHDA